MGDDGQDPDRAAILARRRRFIALALGGLSTGCSPGDETTTTNPQPCLDFPAQTETSATLTGDGDGDPTGDGDGDGGPN